MTRALLSLSLVLASASAHASDRFERPEPTGIEGNVDIVEKLNDPISRDLAFTDSNGRAVHLKDYLSGRPIVLSLVYYRCPVLCSLLLGGLAKAMHDLDWRLGREYDAVTVSIDPDETSAQANSARNGFLQALGQTAPDTRWTFLTGKSEAIDALAESVGFQFHKLDGRREFAHAAALFVLTPDGRISRYLYGVEFPPRQLKSALFEAASGRVGTSFERLILRCYRYNPSTKRYQLFITRYYRAGGIVLLLAVGTLLGLLWRRDLRGART